VPAKTMPATAPVLRPPESSGGAWGGGIVVVVSVVVVIVEVKSPNEPMVPISTWGEATLVTVTV